MEQIQPKRKNCPRLFPYLRELLGLLILEKFEERTPFQIPRHLFRSATESNISYGPLFTFSDFIAGSVRYNQLLDDMVHE